jgi:hypothetical protein
MAVVVLTLSACGCPDGQKWDDDEGCYAPYQGSGSYTYYEDKGDDEEDQTIKEEDEDNNEKENCCECTDDVTEDAETEECGCDDKKENSCMCGCDDNVEGYDSSTDECTEDSPGYSCECQSDTTTTETVEEEEPVVQANDKPTSAEGTYSVVYNTCEPEPICGEDLTKWNQAIWLTKYDKYDCEYLIYPFNHYDTVMGNSDFWFGGEVGNCYAKIVDSQDKNYAIKGACYSDTGIICSFEYEWRTSNILAKDALTCK